MVRMFEGMCLGGIAVRFPKVEGLEAVWRLRLLRLRGKRTKILLKVLPSLECVEMSWARVEEFLVGIAAWKASPYCVVDMRW